MNARILWNRYVPWTGHCQVQLLVRSLQVSEGFEKTFDAAVFVERTGGSNQSAVFRQPQIFSADFLSRGLKRSFLTAFSRTKIP